MGTGYSDSFVGTKGAAGVNKNHQFSMMDELPVRSKVNAKAGIGTSSGDNKRMGNKFAISIEMVLLMCKRYRSDEITDIQLLEWLMLICSDSRFRITKRLRLICEKAIPLFKASLKSSSFNRVLTQFENDLMALN